MGTPSRCLGMPRHHGPPLTRNGYPRTSRRPSIQSPTPPKQQILGSSPIAARQARPPPTLDTSAGGVRAAKLPVACALPALHCLNPAAAVRIEPQQQTKHLPVLSIPLAPPSRQAHPLTRTAQPFAGESWTGRKSQAAPGPACISGCSPAQLSASHVGAGKETKAKAGIGVGEEREAGGIPRKGCCIPLCPGESCIPHAGAAGELAAHPRWMLVLPELIEQRSSRRDVLGAQMEMMARARSAQLLTGRAAGAAALGRGQPRGVPVCPAERRLA